MSLHTPIEFIPSDEFAGADEASMLMLKPGMTIYADRATEGVVDVCGPGDFDLLTNLPLLSQDGERFLFRKMNFLKYQAENLRQQLVQQTVYTQYMQLLGSPLLPPQTRKNSASCKKTSGRSAIILPNAICGW